MSNPTDPKDQTVINPPPSEASGQAPVEPERPAAEDLMDWEVGEPKAPPPEPHDPWAVAPPGALASERTVIGSGDAPAPAC